MIEQEDRGAHEFTSRNLPRRATNLPKVGVNVGDAVGDNVGVNVTGGSGSSRTISQMIIPNKMAKAIFVNGDDAIFEASGLSVVCEMLR